MGIDTHGTDLATRRPTTAARHPAGAGTAARDPAWDRAPERLQVAATALADLRGQGLYFAPIRHHSPVCAAATAAMIAEVKPAAVLIEGPEEYANLLPALQHEATVPPIAVLSLDPGGHSGAGFYPLADFSPEWVALRAAGESGAGVVFIDRPYRTRVTARVPNAAALTPNPGVEQVDTGHIDAIEEDLARTLQAERHLAHSATIAALARTLGCRDHNELWEHLFESRGLARAENWRELFDDVFAWSALARLDYEPEVLAADGSYDREAVMTARITEHRDRLGTAPVVVVTGAFHTLAIVEALTGADAAAPVRTRIPATGFGPVPNDAAWLVRYDHEQLDGLRGYGAGMPSPGYYQRVWAGRSTGPAQGDSAHTPRGAHTSSAAHNADPPASAARLSVDVLLDIAHAAVEGGAQISIAEVSAAAEQAHRLAALRSRPAPGRTDILDALTSCFVKDDGDLDPALAGALRLVFGGRTLGQVPPGTASPPLVSQARHQAEQLRLAVDDSTPRRTRLDTRRNPRHRHRRHFLALMEFTGTGFARQLSGPDYVAGRGLGLLIQEWEYAWNPQVEAALIGLSHLGATMEAVAVARLHQQERELHESSRSCDPVSTLVAQAVTMGLVEHLPRLSVMLQATLDVDPSLASVVACLHRLAGLIEARRELGLSVPDTKTIAQLIDHGLAAITYLIPDLGAVKPEDEDTAIATVVSLRELLQRVAALQQTPHIQQGTSVPDAVRRALTSLRTETATAAGVRGALVALGVVDGTVDEAVLVAAIKAQFTPGADAVAVVRFLGGVLHAAPDLLLHTPELLEAMSAGIGDMSWDSFLAVLPDLRRAFTWFKPAETHRIAERVAAAVGGRADLIDVHIDLDESALAAGTAVERALAQVLVRDGLGLWVPGRGHHD